MKEILYLVLFVLAAGLIWFRVAPHDVDRWHVDPAEVDEPRGNGFRMIGQEAPRFSGDPDTVLDALMQVAMNEPRTRVLEGGSDEGLITFVSRTLWLGLPDYVTFKAVAEGSQTKLSVVSRARYPGSDWGVNRNRLDRWFAELDRRLNS